MPNLKKSITYVYKGCYLKPLIYVRFLMLALALALKENKGDLSPKVLKRVKSISCTLTAVILVLTNEPTTERR